MKKRPYSLMLILRLVLLAALGVPAFPASAAGTIHFDSGPRQLTLMELYTSQGCSSCPPAERWLAKFKADPRLWHSIIPVAFHVDYWDYLGWRDTLADALYSQRQRRYHREGKLRTIYTPAFVVNGEEWRSWFGLRQLSQSKAMPGSLRVTLEKQILLASFKAATGRPTPLQLHVAIVGVGRTENIGAGENRGHTLTQDFAVRSAQPVMILPIALNQRSCTFTITPDPLGQYGITDLRPALKMQRQSLQAFLGDTRITCYAGAGLTLSHDRATRDRGNAWGDSPQR